MTHKYPDNETRLENIYKRLGTRNPKCTTCDETDPFCMELHHLAGKDHHDDLSIVCRNCHSKLSNKQRDRMACNPVDPETGKLGHYLFGLIDFLEMIIPTLRRFAQKLLNIEPPASDEETL